MPSLPSVENSMTLIRQALITQQQRIALEKSYHIPSETFGIEFCGPETMFSVVGNLPIAISHKETNPVSPELGMKLDDCWFEFEARVKARSKKTTYHAENDFTSIDGSTVIVPGHTMGIFAENWHDMVVALNAGLDDDLKIDEALAAPLDALIGSNEIDPTVKTMLDKVLNRPKNPGDARCA